MASNVKDNIHFFRGEHVTLKLYQDDTPVLLQATNWSVEQNSTEIAEGVNGENRDRLDIVLNYYSASCDVNQTDQEVMDALMADQDNEDNVNLPLDKQGAIIIRHRNGTKAAYILKNITLGPWNENMSGRADPVKLTLKMRFNDFQKAPVF